MRWVGFWLVFGAVIAASTPVRAQRRASQEVTQAIELLQSRDESEVRTAIESLGVLGDRRAAGPLAERIRRGLPPELLEAAIDALAVLGRPESAAVLFDLTSHRRAAVRLRAVQALATIRPRGAEQVLTRALADSDPSVRGAAATALGEMGATGALDALFRALDRQVPEAALAIGRLARPAEAERFLGYVGRLPFDLVTPALAEMLQRTTLAERTRLAIVHRLTELATSEVRAFLEQLVPSLPDSPVRRAAEDAIPRIGQ